MTKTRVIKRGYADTPFGQIHYAQAGSGTPLLLIGSSPRSCRSFKNVQMAFGSEFRTIAIDLLGFGNSDTPPDGFDIDAHARSVVAVMDVLGIERTHFFGLHTGNKVGAALAANAPQRIDRLVLAGQTHSMVIDKEARNKAIKAFEYRHSPRYPESPDGSHLVREWTAAIATAVEYALPPHMRVEPSVTENDISNAQARVLDHLMGRRGIVAMYRNVYEYDFPAVLRRIQAPTLILELLTEAEAHFGKQGPLLCKMMKDARTSALADADGLVIEYRAQEVVDAVSDFFLGR